MVVVRAVDDGGVAGGDGEGIASGGSQDKRRGGASSLVVSSEVGCVVGEDGVDDGSVSVVVVDNG